MAIDIRSCQGAEMAPYLDDIARLRMAVFREFPYLYEGSLANEARYLAGYAADERHLAVLALDGAQVVGVSTAMPLLNHGDDVAAPFLAAGYQPEEIFYFGESVLDAAYRGRGLGNAFFTARETFGRAQGFGLAAFCAVVRPEAHPLRPADYVPHDAFWQRRGYQKHIELQTKMSWQDLDEAQPTAKPMVFWTKAL